MARGQYKRLLGCSLWSDSSSASRLQQLQALGIQAPGESLGFCSLTAQPHLPGNRIPFRFWKQVIEFCNLRKSLGSASAAAGMRSRLLISVALLPTISESSEMMMLGGTQAKGDELQSDLLSSQSLDDYVKSICQLAQPTSVLDGTQRLPYNRPRRQCKLRGKTLNDATSVSQSEKPCPGSSLQDITARFSGQHPTLTQGTNIDPLDWLFGESQPKRQSRKDASRRTGSNADPSPLHKQTETGKSRVARRVRACETKVPGSPLVKLSSEWGKGLERRTQPSMLNTALKLSSKPHQGRIPRSLNSNLPVIYEL